VTGSWRRRAAAGWWHRSPSAGWWRRRAPASQCRPWAGSPVYARLLRLRSIRPGGLLCFLFFEGSIGLSVLLVLAELTSIWALVAVPVSVAAMVKLNDVLAGLHRRAPRIEPEVRRVPPRSVNAGPVVRGQATVPPQPTRPAAVRWPAGTNQRRFG
jgi:hypothetical protein